MFTCAFVLWMLCSQASVHTCVAPQSQHSMSVRFQRARHHCAGDRQLLRCVHHNRQCYRCSCHLRDVTSPQVAQGGFLEHGHHDDRRGASTSPSAPPSASPSPSLSAECAPPLCATYSPFILRYATQHRFSRFAVRYAGHITYQLPTRLRATLHIRYSGASSVMRLCISASSHWHILVECPA